MNASDTANPIPPQPEKGDSDLLRSFLASVDRFAEEFVAQVLGAVGNAEDRLVIESTGTSFIAQTRRLTDCMREVAGDIVPSRRRDLDMFLRVQDGPALVRRSLETSAKMLAPGGPKVTRGFLSWIDEIMHALKKIINAIWGIFGTVPDWLNSIELLIDELVDLLLSLFGEKSGLPAAQLADEFSRSEVNFLHEMAALATLQAAGASHRTREDDVSS